MTTPRTLPDQPSLESLRKQSKKLARDVAAGDARAQHRVRAQLPRFEPPLSLRDAQLVVAREYGYAGWNDLKAEVLRRSGAGIEWAARDARRAIHDNDVERLRALLGEYPTLVAWRDSDPDPTLIAATGSWANDASNDESVHTRPVCAELLLDAGARVDPELIQRVIDTRARAMLELFRQKGVLGRSLPVLAALGEIDDVPTSDDRTLLEDAFRNACRLEQRASAALVLRRLAHVDPDLGRRIERSVGQSAFVEFMCTHSPDVTRHEATGVPGRLWRAYVTERLLGAMRDGDLPTFAALLDQEPYLLDESSIGTEVALLEQATDARFVEHLFARDPALLHLPKPPRSLAVTWAVESGRTSLVPLLTRIWPLPDDLPHAAGMGDLDRVKRWFDEEGQPKLGDPSAHYAHWDLRNSTRTTVQNVLDAALGWSCLNHHFDVAAFLLEHGADIDTRWSTHEPASILHEAAVRGDMEAAAFLIDRGIDLSIRDHRYHATAEGWARHAARDERMTTFLAEAAARRAIREP